MSFFQDEKGRWSAARVFLAAWLGNAAAYVWMRPDSPSLGAVLTFFSGVAIPLVVWTAGPRIAEYLAPQAGAMVGAVAEGAKSLAAKVAARRNLDAGYEDSR